jgi:hypothetical protein
VSDDLDDLLRTQLQAAYPSTTQAPNQLQALGPRLQKARRSRHQSVAAGLCTLLALTGGAAALLDARSNPSDIELIAVGGPLDGSTSFHDSDLSSTVPSEGHQGQATDGAVHEVTGTAGRAEAAGLSTETNDSATAVANRASSAPASTGTPSSRAHMIWIRSSGRGRLPVCVVGICMSARDLVQEAIGHVVDEAPNVLFVTDEGCHVEPLDRLAHIGVGIRERFE